MGEILVKVPPEIVIEAETYIEEDDIKYDPECHATRSHIREMRLGNKSEFGPYVQYLLAQSPGQLPSAWSSKGKELLYEYIRYDEDRGRQHPPPEGISDMLNRYYYRCIDIDDTFEVNAVMLSMQRSWDETMIPLYNFEIF